VLSSILGFSAVDALIGGKNGVMVGIKNNNIQYTPFSDAITKKKSMNKELLRMSHILAQ
jgi:6-phosphofructokinase 1